MVRAPWGLGSQPKLCLFQRGPGDSFAATTDTLLAFVARESGPLEARLAAGRIVEGHGDLRPEHICLLERPVVIDYLEFNREYRVLDVADELAYLAMECARLGAAGVGEAIFAACCQRMGDRVPPRLFRFYCGYRALERAKISAPGPDTQRPVWAVGAPAGTCQAAANARK